MLSDRDIITRVIMGNVPTWLAAAFYVTALGACAFAAIAIAMRLRRHRRGNTRLPRERSLSAAIISVLVYLTFHQQLRRDRYAGTAHMLMFYGFFILFIGTCLVFLEHDTPLHFFHGRFYLIASLIIDLGGAAFIVGLVMFLARRGVTAVPGAARVHRGWWVASLAWLLLAIGVTGFLLEGARIAVDMPAFERWSVVGYAVALSLRTIGIEGDGALALHRAMWAGHAVLCVVFFALLPWKFFSHMVYGAVSWATRSQRPRSQLRLPAPQVAPGAAHWSDLAWRDLAQADACTTCGRCNEVCPAHAAGKPLRPREVVLGLRQAINLNGQGNLPAFVPDDMLWSCTTCAACNEACPVGIEIYDKIVEMRRGRIETGIAPAPAVEVFESTAERFNPFNKSNDDRMNWAMGLDVSVAAEDEPIELLYWVGCAGSFDPDGRGVSRAMVRILRHLGVKYHVLGKRERCTGDPARRLGEEGLFQERAAANIATLREHGVKRILTHCPHCYNSFLNEYPQLGGAFEVEHHSQFLARMVREGKLKSPGGGAAKPQAADSQAASSRAITFHDPCYLGRGNGETAAPRDVLLALPQATLTEMPRSGRESFCCGAGGGAMWLDVPGQTRVENLRVAEAAATGAATVATGCPFCKSMMMAGRQSTDTAIEVKDLAELIVEAQGL